MLPPPDFEALVQRLEEGRRTSSQMLLFLGRACGRYAGAPDLVDLANQALALLEPDRPSAPSTAPLDQRRLKELQRALVTAFPSRAQLEQMVSYGAGLGVALSEIATERSLTGTVEALIEWAKSTNRLDALVTAATTYNPGNAALRAVTSRDARRGEDASPAILQEFRDRFRELSGLERYSLLQTIYRRIPVPPFYLDLARLVKAGYVRHVLTTNTDSLFEQALESIGLVRDVGFEVILLGTVTSREALDKLDAPASTPLIFKLHGDITQGEFGVTPDEIDYAVNAAKRFIRNELQGDLTIVGYEGESQPVNDWLARSPGDVWWVCTQLTDGVTLPTNAKWLQLSPVDFFGALAARLLTLRAPVAAPSAARHRARSAALESAVDGPLESAVAFSAPPPEPSEYQLLHQEIERLRSEARSLEQPASDSGTALQRQEQAAQRRRRIRELEDQLRALPAARDQILQLLDRVQQSVAEAEHPADESVPLDPATREYFAGQMQTLREQYKSGQPNPHVVSAALGAALVLAERLGPSVIDPQDAQELAAFGPTIVGRS